jgi:hypothetical protein
MRNRHLLFWLVVAIAAITLVSGLVQVFLPGFILRILGTECSPASLHFFGLVGMFMALFGGALLNAMLNPSGNKVLIFWCGLQKIGAVFVVIIGVAHGVFSWLALPLPVFDLASAVVIFGYLLALGNA